MKKKLTFIMILVVLALTSCSDFLDKYPKYGVDPEKGQPRIEHALSFL